MFLSDFDYELPEELIAQQPLEQRDASRMLILDRAAQTREDSKFAVFPEYVRAGDVVVVNNTRVFPARLTGRREPSGGRVEVLLVREVEPGIWEALVRPAQRLKVGARLRFGDDLFLAAGEKIAVHSGVARHGRIDVETIDRGACRGPA